MSREVVKNHLNDIRQAAVAIWFHAHNLKSVEPAVHAALDRIDNLAGGIMEELDKLESGEQDGLERIKLKFKIEGANAATVTRRDFDEMLESFLKDPTNEFCWQGDTLLLKDSNSVLVFKLVGEVKIDGCE